MHSSFLHEEESARRGPVAGVVIRATCIDDRLDLVLGASGDVGDGPAGLLLDALLLRGLEQVQEAGEGAAADDDLGLHVVPRHDVPHGPQRRHQHVAALMPARTAHPLSQAARTQQQVLAPNLPVEFSFVRRNLLPNSTHEDCMVLLLADAVPPAVKLSCSRSCHR